MNRRSATVCVAAFLVAVAPLQVLADDDCTALRGDERILPGDEVPRLGAKWKRMELPAGGDVGDALAQLDVEDVPLVYSIDLNGDGRPELLLTTPESRLCGNAGCPYRLLDRRTMKQLGEFFGHLYVLDERVHGYRIIQSVSRRLVGASNLDTYVFDGKAYRLVSHAILDPCGLEQWGRRMRYDGR